MPVLLPLLLIGIPLLLVALSYMSDLRSRRRTGHTRTIDESDLRFLDNVPGFRVADQEEKSPDVD